MKSLLILLLAVAAGSPARAPVEGCAWEKFSDPALGLEAWVQRCDFGFRKIDFTTKGQSLAVRYSDGGTPDPVVDLIEVLPDESGEAAVKRFFVAGTKTDVAARCELSFFEGSAAPKGARRYTFVPNAAYRKELERDANPNEVPDPPCGPWGESPDGVQYFEVHEGARRILFVRVGQDTPLFDEQSLRVLGGKSSATITIRQ
jgi:hypothetical protein